MRLKVMCALLLGVAACGKPATERSVDESREQTVRFAIEAQYAAHTEGNLRADAKAAMAMFADDGIFIESGPPVIGRANLESREAELYKSVKVLSEKRRVLDLRVFGDVAYEIGTNDYVIEDVARGTVRGQAHYMVSWVHAADGSWKIHRAVAESSPLAAETKK